MIPNHCLPLLLFVAPAAAVAGFPGRPAASEPEKAEYAVRWDPAAGGPATGEEALAFLGAPSAAPVRYEVRYYDAPPPAGAPPDSEVILRRRSETNGESEIRLKYRLDHPIAEWTCPAGGGFDGKAEVDVGFGVDGASRVYSYSCVASAAEPPPFLRAASKSCVSQMARWPAPVRGGGSYKVESWTLPDGSKRLEISRTAKNSPKQLSRFGALVERLRARGARPLEESKTELGSRCTSPPLRSGSARPSGAHRRPARPDAGSTGRLTPRCAAAPAA